MKLRLLLLSIVVAAAGCHSQFHPVGTLAHLGSLGEGPPAHNLPPAVQLMEPGPGVGGPGPGVMIPQPLPAPPAQASQVSFVSPDGMMISWDVTGPGRFDSEPLIVPGRYNFPQGAIYRLKLTSVPGRPGVELYPTLEIGPTLPRTDAYLAHNAIPVQFSEEDFDQVLTGNFVTKVIYLPDSEFQELAVAGVETLVSTRLDPGVDPIVEADRRGAIMAIVRMGNKDLQVPGGAFGPDGVQQVAYFAAQQGRPGAPIPDFSLGGSPTYSPSAIAPSLVSGVTVPDYGMPITGTPIGLPGPPHLPLGIPAGLRRHTISNHTPIAIPGPTPQVDVHVRQTPGMSYPRPANTVYIHERVIPEGQGSGCANCRGHGCANCR